MQTKQRLINRLRWYYPMELAHAVFTFPALLLFTIYYFPIQEVIFLSYGLLVCISILYQGQRYWNIKLKSLRGQSIDVAKQLSFFKKSKKRNVVLIAAMPIVGGKVEKNPTPRQAHLFFANAQKVTAQKNKRTCCQR